MTILGNAPTYLALEQLKQRGLFACVIPAMSKLRAPRAGSEKIDRSYTLHPSLNTWSRHRPEAMHRVKMEWEEWYIMHLREANFPRLTHPPVFCMLVYNFPDSRARDYDNHAPKFLMDALVKYGAIPDDSDQILGAHPFIVHKSCPGHPHILLLLTENVEIYLELVAEYLPVATAAR